MLINVMLIKRKACIGFWYKDTQKMKQKIEKCQKLEWVEWIEVSKSFYIYHNVFKNQNIDI